MGNSLEQWRASIGNWTGRILTTASDKDKDFSLSPWYQIIVVLVLLIIGGIEMNPGPNQNEGVTFKKTAGFSDMTGENYEWKLSALLFLRALETGEEFLLASNMTSAGNFDDVVLKLGRWTLFLQLKHKKNSETILKLRDLARNKNFNLLKYLKSYLVTKQCWQQNPDLQHFGRFEDVKFVIYTNAKVNEGLVNVVASTDVLSIVRTSGSCFSLTELIESLPKCRDILLAALKGEGVIATSELWDVVHRLYNKQVQVLPSTKQLEEMLNDVTSLWELTLYPEFISQLYLCTEQLGEREIDRLIREEFVALCGTDAVLDKFLAGIFNWWRNSNCYLTAKSQFWQEILHICAANVIKPCPGINVKFGTEHCNTISHTVAAGNRLLYIHTRCIVLTCMKVAQSLETKLFVDASTLQTCLDEVLAIWKLGTCDVLVVDGETADTNILHKLSSMGGTKCVAVVSETAQYEQLYQQFKFVSLTDTFCLNHLDSESEHEILVRRVMFQGFLVKLNLLADIGTLRRAVTADDVVQLNGTLQIGRSLPDLDSCYLSRVLMRKDIISKRIFTEENIILAVKDLSLDRLTQLVPTGIQVEAFNLKNNTVDRNCRCFIVGDITEFTALCRVQSNVHWVEERHGDLLWLKSKGDISPILKQLEPKCSIYSSVREILALPQQLVLVVAEPGMGKSTEMCNISHVIKKGDPSAWVIRVNLNLHRNLLREKLIGTVGFLERVMALETDFQRSLLEHGLKSRGNVIIIFDGFDEIIPVYSDTVFNLLRELSKMKITKIFVTCRTTMAQQLEQEFSTLAFTIKEISPEDQECFLDKYWNKSHTNTGELSCDMSFFISSLLKLVRTSIDDHFKEFTGFPLHTKMLAEVFQNKASYYRRTGEMKLPQSLDVLQLYDMFVEKKWEVYCEKLNEGVNTAMLCEIIEKQKHQLQHNYMNCAVISYLDDSYIKHLHNSVNLKQLNDDFMEKFNNGDDKTGIITEFLQDKAVFVHRTFTEYFVAMWYSKNIDLEYKNVRSLYLNNNFEIVRKFLDRMLAVDLKLHTAVLNKDLTAITNILAKGKFDVNQKDKGGRTALHLAIVNCYYFNTDYKVNESIIEILLERDIDVNCEDRILSWTPLRLAETINDWFAVDKLLGKQGNGQDLVLIKKNIVRKRNYQTPIQIISGKSFNSIFKYRIRVRNPINVMYSLSPLLRNIIHLALKNGYVNLVKFILEYGVSVEDYVDSSAHSSIYRSSKYRHENELTLVEFLTQRAEIDKLFIRSRYKIFKTSMLHLSVEHGQLKMVEFLVGRGADIERFDAFYKTPLMWAVECSHFPVANLLIDCGASVNARYDDGETALFLAARKGKYETIQMLLEKGADVDVSVGECKSTALMQAVVMGHLQVAELLLRHKSSVNKRDVHGDTALLLSACMGRDEILESLVKYGAEVDVSDSVYSRTPLMWAAKYGHYRISKHFLKLAVSVDAQDKYGDTALTLAAGDGRNCVVELLLENGANIERACGKLNKTALILAAERGHVGVTGILINKGALINARDVNGQTALLMACREGKCEIVQLLLERGADVEMPGWYDRTPLMQAVEWGHMKIAELLLNSGASVNAVDVFGNTAQALADHYKCNNIKKLLE